MFGLLDYLSLLLATTSTCVSFGGFEGSCLFHFFSLAWGEFEIVCFCTGNARANEARSLW